MPFFYTIIVTWIALYFVIKYFACLWYLFGAARFSENKIRQNHS